MNIVWEKQSSGIGVPTRIDREEQEASPEMLIPSLDGNILDFPVSTIFLRSLCKHLDMPYEWIVSVPEDLAVRSFEFAVNRYNMARRRPFTVSVEDGVLTGIVSSHMEIIDPYLVAEQLNEIGYLEWRRDGVGFNFTLVDITSGVDAEPGDSLRSLAEVWIPFETSVGAEVRSGIHRLICNNIITFPTANKVNDQFDIATSAAAYLSDANIYVKQLVDIAIKHEEIDPEENSVSVILAAGAGTITPFYKDMIFTEFRRAADRTRYGLVNAMSKAGTSIYELRNSRKICESTGKLILSWV